MLQLNDNDEILKIKKINNKIAKQTRWKYARKKRNFKFLIATFNMFDDSNISKQDHDVKYLKLLTNSDISFIAINVNMINSKNVDALNIIEFIKLIEEDDKNDVSLSFIFTVIALFLFIVNQINKSIIEIMKIVECMRKKNEKNEITTTDSAEMNDVNLLQLLFIYCV